MAQTILMSYLKRSLQRDIVKYDNQENPNSLLIQTALTKIICGRQCRFTAAMRAWQTLAYKPCDKVRALAMYESHKSFANTGPFHLLCGSCSLCKLYTNCETRMSLLGELKTYVEHPNKQPHKNTNVACCLGPPDLMNPWIYSKL